VLIIIAQFELLNNYIATECDAQTMTAESRLAGVALRHRGLMLSRKLSQSRRLTLLGQYQTVLGERSSDENLNAFSMHMGLRP
jgi:hypothetical protein